MTYSVSNLYQIPKPPLLAVFLLLLALCLAGLAKRLEMSLSKGHTARTAKARAI